MNIFRSENDKLCSRCEKTLQSFESLMEVLKDQWIHLSDDHLRTLTGSWFYHHRAGIESDSLYDHTAKYLIKSAPLCIFCSFFLSRLSPTWNKMWKQHDRLTCLPQEEIAWIVEELGDQPVHLSAKMFGDCRKLSIVRPGKFENNITLYFGRDPHALCHSSEILKRLSPLSSSNCPEAFDFIRKQARKCHLHHRTCHGERTGSKIPPKLPSRVLDLGSAPDSKDVRLVETHSVMFGFYTALSHCWGPEHKRPLTTEIGTLHVRKLGIAWNDLPQTFQDAVATSREIGVQYLWIDSLCIIQDDTEDWRRESAKMADVYTNAWVTIAASYARDSTEGLFDACFRPSLDLLELPCNTSSVTKSGPIFVTAALGPIGVGGSGPLWDWAISQPDLEILATRGWTTQEAILSSCTVYFTRHFLFWSCCINSIDETGIEYHPSVSPKLRNYTWYQIVQEFSKRSLTYPTDKLMALGGISSHFRTTQSKIYGEQFVFGHWTKHLPSCLLWSTTRANRESNPLIMPTWSWASSMSPVSWEHWVPGFASGCEIIAFPTSSDPHIVLRGKVKVLAEAAKDLQESEGGRAGGRYALDGDMKDGPAYGLLVASCNPSNVRGFQQALVLQRRPESKNTYERAGILRLGPDDKSFYGCSLQKITLV